MKLGASSLVLALAALLAVQGCTKTVYYAVMAPRQTMNDQSSCFRQCQMLHAGKTKELLLCVDSCPDTRVVKQKRCEDVEFAQDYGCTTMHNQTFDGVSFGLGIGLLVLLNILIIALVASSNNNQQTQF